MVQVGLVRRAVTFRRFVSLCVGGAPLPAMGAALSGEVVVSVAEECLLSIRAVGCRDRAVPFAGRWVQASPWAVLRMRRWW